jgi:hypothetical protein
MENGRKHEVLLDRGMGVDVSRSRRALRSELMRVRGQRPHHRSQSKVTGRGVRATLVLQTSRRFGRMVRNGRRAALLRSSLRSKKISSQGRLPEKLEPIQFQARYIRRLHSIRPNTGKSLGDHWQCCFNLSTFPSRAFPAEIMQRSSAIACHFYLSSSPLVVPPTSF